MVTATNNRQDAGQTVGANGLHLRFRAPKRFELLSEYTDGEHIAFGVPSGDGGDYEEAIDIYHYHAGPNETIPTGHSDIEALATMQGWQELDLRPPVSCLAGGYMGEFSTFRCLIPDPGKRIAGAVWTATVAGDHVAVCYRCMLKWEPMLDETMGVILSELTVMERAAPDPMPSNAPTPAISQPNSTTRLACPRGQKLRSLPWHNIRMAMLLLPVFVLASLLGIRDGHRIVEIENPSTSVIAPAGGVEGTPTGTPVDIGAQYISDSIVTLSTPGINFVLPSTISTMDTSDSPSCAQFVGRTARLVVCNQVRRNSLYDDWDFLRRAVVLANAKDNLSDVVEEPNPFSTSEGITGVEGIIRYTAKADGAAIEEWQMIGVTPREEQFSIYYLTGPDHPLDASPMSPDHLIRDTITVNVREWRISTIFAQS
jgi:hypothetical protein